MDKENIKSEIKKLEAELVAARNATDKAVLADKIKSLKIELDKVEITKEKEFVPTKDVSCIADHDKSNANSRGTVIIGEGSALIDM